MVKSCRIVSFLESLVFDVGFPFWRIEGELERAVLKVEALPVDPYLLCIPPGEPIKFSYVVWMVALAGCYTDIFAALKVGDFCLVEFGLLGVGDIVGPLLVTYVPNLFLKLVSALTV